MRPHAHDQYLMRVHPRYARKIHSHHQRVLFFELVHTVLSQSPLLQVNELACVRPVVLGCDAHPRRRAGEALDAVRVEQPYAPLW